MICPDCGAELHCGDFPFCHGDPTKHGRSAASAIGDECDIVQENGFRVPTRFTSKAELKRALAAKGLEMRVRHVTIPGTDKSPHTTDWSKGSMDPYTLEAARALVERVTSTPSTTTNDEGWPVTFSIRDLP